MIRGNEIVFKNDEIERIILYSNRIAADNDPGAAFRNKKKSEKIQLAAEGIIGGYLSSLLQDAMMNTLSPDDWFDLSYDTIDKLPLALMALFKLQQTSYPIEKNIELIAKTMGAILFGLAVNEHGFALHAVRGFGSPLWADGIKIFIGKDRTDFLETALSSVFRSPLSMNEDVFINSDELISIYKDVTGVDLSEKGFASMLLS